MGYCVGCGRGACRMMGQQFTLKSCGYTTGGWICLILVFATVVIGLIYYARSGGVGKWAHEAMDAAFPTGTGAAGAGSAVSSSTSSNRTTHN
ncbi:hypothetical protein DACRYDRAFT_19599 [Dacryopinax primogenitus]|uniref:Uncharacterized protein n=1 Tax=Dacryopinax primogenitus (strain DJM 731) TaxID=1858805 RepID=M5GBS7_DACPD|nr:uncharacterized protein DACRYDRAFT_19599 [Dacryopinax primogenitus]EJU06444.1 hypothetical protein DACRYDRAFT_19599 [Dacryopinax primogenitus]